MLTDVAFECSLKQVGAALAVTYTIRNGRDEDLGVFNKIRGLGTDGGVDFSPDRVYVDLDGATLRLLKMALPIPAGLSMAAYVPPNASLLPAGKSLVETFTVPIPVRVQHPYKRAMISGEVAAVEPRSVKAVAVGVGVFRLLGTRLVAEHPAFPDVMTVMPPDPAVTGQVLLTAGFTPAAAIAVLDYKGFPWA